MMHNGTTRPRILVLTSTFPRGGEDTEPRFVLDLCREIAKAADVVVIAPHTAGAAIEEDLEGVRVRRFRYFISRWQSVAYRGGIMARLKENPWRALQIPFFLVGLWRAVYRESRTWKPNAIHAHWIVPQALVACLAAPRTIPILCTSHGGDLHGLRGTFFGKLKAFALRRCRATTVVSESMVPKLRSLGVIEHVDVIPMGTNLTLFAPPATESARDTDHVLFVGRLVEKKGVVHLLNAMHILKRAGRHLRLTIAGDGPLRSELLRQAADLGIADDVVFVGSIAHTDLPELYQRATVAVFPFVVASDGDAEGFGLVVVEAMGCACPVIASDIPAVRQTIEPEVTGVLAPPGDAAALAQTIERLVDSPPLRAKLAATALENVRSRFDWNAVGAQYRDVISRILA